MSKKYTYPAVFTQNEDGTYGVWLIDLSSMARANTKREAIEVTKEAIEFAILELESNGHEAPEKTIYPSIKLHTNQIVLEVTVELDGEEEKEERVVRNKREIPNSDEMFKKQEEERKAVEAAKTQSPAKMPSIDDL